VGRSLKAGDWSAAFPLRSLPSPLSFVSPEEVTSTDQYRRLVGSCASRATPSKAGAIRQERSSGVCALPFYATFSPLPCLPVGSGYDPGTTLPIRHLGYTEPRARTILPHGTSKLVEAESMDRTPKLRIQPARYELRQGRSLHFLGPSWIESVGRDWVALLKEEGRASDFLSVDLSQIDFVTLFENLALRANLSLRRHVCTCMAR
jgi:hypothetical protein